MRRRFHQSIHSSVCDLDVFEAAPRSTAMDQLGLVEPDDAFGHGIVVGVSDGSDRGGDAFVDEPVGVDDRGVLPRFKGSSQRQHLQRIVVARRELRLVSSKPGSCAVVH